MENIRIEKGHSAWKFSKMHMKSAEAFQSRHKTSAELKLFLRCHDSDLYFFLLCTEGRIYIKDTILKVSEKRNDDWGKTVDTLIFNVGIQKEI